MKKIFFAALSMVILSLGASSLYARGMGDCGGPGMGMHKPFQHLEMLQYQLDLTNAQVDKLYNIDKEYMDKFHQNRNDADKIKDLREKHQGEIESILTPDQKKKWSDFLKNHPMKERGISGKSKKGTDSRPFGPMGGMAGAGFHNGFMQKELGLKDEQIDKIFKIHKDYMDKFYQNRNDAEKVKDLRTKQDAEIENVLTPEQKTKWKEFKKNRPMHDMKSRDGKERGKHRRMDNEK